MIHLELINFPCLSHDEVYNVTKLRNLGSILIQAYHMAFVVANIYILDLYWEELLSGPVDHSLFLLGGGTLWRWPVQEFAANFLPFFEGRRQK